MKILLLATAAAFAIAGTGMATAQTSVGADVNAGYTHAGTKTYVHKHRRKHRVTTGIETRDNNASARGTLLPGKDRLNSKGYIQDK